MDIPEQLFSEIQAGRCILFLGRDTATYTRHPDGKRYPSETDLATALATQFLGPAYQQRSLGEVVELAISEHDYKAVHGFVADLLAGFLPGAGHLLIPSLHWQAIAGTTVDLAVERAFERSKHPLQNCRPFTRNGEKIAESLHDSNDLMYLKLHGSITHAQTDATALLLTTDQYPTHRASRSRLFERLQEFALEFPIIALGGSLSDSDLRALLQVLSSLPLARPMSYVVAPAFSPADERFWASRKFHSIKAHFDEFLKTIDAKISREGRKLAPLLTNDHAILRRSILPGKARLSQDLAQALERDLDYIYPGYTTAYCNPKEFYKGYLQDWSPIAQDLDVKRSLTEEILTDVFLPSEEEMVKGQQLYVLKGHAGSGKTVLLRRLAWDAAQVFDKLCLYTRCNELPSLNIIQQVCELTRQRVFLFIDRVGEAHDQIERLLSAAERKNLPLTIVGGIRSNAWNIHRDQLEPLTSITYELEYLTNTELEDLVIVLDKHRSLGRLEGLTKREQVEALAKRAGRQLLVALHEATLGRAFGDIVFDEYRSIGSAQAKALYLTVCVLHSLNIPVRAGLISRVHQVPFSQFKNELFAPLDSIVYTRPSNAYKDFEYVSRHQHVAELVVERALLDGQARFDEYARIVGHLDIDYDTDRDSLYALLSAKHLRRSFADEQIARNLYATAERRFPDHGAVSHQHAIFEMSARPPAFDKAAELLQRALQLEPWSRNIKHSLAELAMKRAEHSSEPTGRTRYRSEARRLLNQTEDPRAGESYTYHSRLKLLLDELKDMEGDTNDVAFEEKVKEIEKATITALGTFPGNPHLLEAQSRFYAYLNELPRAHAALRSAYERNRHSPYLALSLARLYEKRGDAVSGLKVLREAVDSSPHDKELNFELAKHLIATRARSEDIKYHLRRSFVLGDGRHDAQYLYARFLYSQGDVEESKNIFSRLRDAELPEGVKRRHGHSILDADTPARFSGSLASLDASHAWVQRDKSQDLVFCHSNNSRGVDWSRLRVGMRITFEIGFNFRGPLALNVRPERMELERATKNSSIRGNEWRDEVRLTDGELEDGSASAASVPFSSRGPDVEDGADFSAAIVFIALKDLKSCSDAPQIPSALTALHAGLKDVNAYILGTLTGVIVVIRDDADISADDVLAVLDGLPRPFEMSLGVAHGHVDALKDVDGRQNLIGPEINIAARLAFARENPGCLVHDSYARSVEGTLAASHWLHPAKRKRVEVRGKQHDPAFICYESPFAYPKTADAAAAPALPSMFSVMISYDLPDFSKGDRAQLRKRFEASTKIFRKMLSSHTGITHLAPGGDGGILVFPGLNPAQGARFCHQLDEHSQIENRDRGDSVRVTMRMGVHYGRIMTFNDRYGILRPTGRELFVSDLVAGDEIARKQSGVIMTQAIARALAGGSQEQLAQRFDKLAAAEVGSILDGVERFIYRPEPRACGA